MRKPGYWKSIIARRARLVLVALALTIPLHAPSKASEQEAFGPPPLAYSEADQPTWLPRILDRLKTKKRWPLQEHLLFHQDGQPAFLALIWQKDFGWDVLELYKVKVRSPRNVRLEFVRGFEESQLSIESPSGYDIAGDGAPFLFLHYGCGGSAPTCYGLRAYRLIRNSVDVTPDWAGRSQHVIRLKDKFALITIDDRWAYSYNGCGACGPWLDSIMSWRDGRYRAACLDYPQHYEDRMMAIEQFRADYYIASRKESLLEHLKHEMDNMLNELQMGNKAAARQRYAAALAEVDRRRAINPDEFAYAYADDHDDWLAYTEENFGRVIDNVDTRSACPLLTYEGKPHYPPNF